MDCRGSETRQWIVKKYNVVPVAHIQLLAGQTKHSDAGATIENDYYIFHANDRETGTREIIQCGMGAARDFLKLLNHEGLPLFNSLHGGGGEGGAVRNLGGGERRREIIWNPVARQLYNAIMWLIIIIDAKPDTPIFEIKEKVYRYRNRDPFHSQVKAVNTIIRKNLTGRTLTEAIDELRTDNDLRDELCQFDLLNEIINNYTDKDGNHEEIEALFI